MPLSDIEKAGVTDLLYQEEENQNVLVPLARNVINHAVEITTIPEALEYVLTNSDNIMCLLNKKLVTKEILFKYLHRKRVPFPFNATKITLINKVLAHWNDESNKLDNENDTIKNQIPKSSSRLSGMENIKSRSNVEEKNEELPTQQFPIHALAQQFSEWFFNNYNKGLLQHCDFWPDASLLLNVIANDGSNENECSNAESVVQTLQEARHRFNFYFLPNLTEAGVQGRMDVHGLAIALACGTLHTVSDCVGVFECAFGLLRDPFANNNWKCKSIRMQLRSTIVAGTTPSLAESDSLREALMLPTPEGDLE